MNKPEFLSLGVTKQLAYINRLEEMNRQKTDLIKHLEDEHKKDIKINYFAKGVKE